MDSFNLLLQRTSDHLKCSQEVGLWSFGTSPAQQQATLGLNLWHHVLLFQANSSILVHCSLQFAGTACTVLYCLLWDGSDGVLDRQGWTSPKGELNHRHTLQVLQGFISSEDASFFSRLISKSKDMPLHNCLHERNLFKVDSIVEWFIQFTRNMRSSNLVAARNTTPLCYTPSEAPQDASHVPDSFWRFAKDQGITGRRRGAGTGWSPKMGVWKMNQLWPNL